MELCRNSSKSWQIRGEGGHVDIDVGGRDVDVEALVVSASSTLGLANILDADAGAKHLQG